MLALPPTLALPTQVIELFNVVALPTLSVPDKVQGPETLTEPFKVVAALTLNGCENVAEPLPAAKVSAVLKVLLLVCPLDANCKARTLLPLPASVNNHRHVGSVSVLFTVQGAFNVVDPPIVLVLETLSVPVSVQGPFNVVEPDTFTFVAVTVPEATISEPLIVDVLLNVPVFMIPPAVTVPETLTLELLIVPVFIASAVMLVLLKAPVVIVPEATMSDALMVEVLLNVPVLLIPFVCIIAEN
eukprot:jgi/Astpho2/8008/fgenesh1_pg.00120_%23_5_t